jgi:hypothetical protein
MDEDLKNEIYIYKSLINNNLRESWVKKNLPKFYEFIIKKPGKTLSEKFYLIYNNIGKCKICELETKFLSYNRGYRLYCSKQCSNNDKDLINLKKVKYKETCLDKYGVENSSSSEEVKIKLKESKSKLDKSIINEKIKKTCLSKYGVDNPSKVLFVKEKRKKTNIKNWGVENVFQSSLIKEKLKMTNIEKYGFDHPLKSNIIKKKIKDTNIKKYGIDNYTKTDLYKTKMYNDYKNGVIRTSLNDDLNYVNFLGNGFYEMKCDTEKHNYFIHRHLYHARKKINSKICLVCNPINSLQSVKELQLFEFIKSVYSGKIIQSYRDGLEIDIYLPELNLGFEFNGLYWHSELFKDKYYHLDKTNYFKEKGIRIIHIWEDDWEYKTDIIKSQIKNWLFSTLNRIFARKCQIKEINNTKLVKDFLERNHIQGNISSTLKIGLFYKDELVSLMTFDHFEGRKLMSNNEWNLSRFCNKINTNVIGSASKLLSYFIKVYNPERIISYADKEWSIGNIYYKLNFNVKSESKPNYKYIIDNKRINKQRFKKSRLIKMGFDESLSEKEIMENNFTAFKIFDCGQIKFEMLLKNKNIE